MPRLLLLCSVSYTVYSVCTCRASIVKAMENCIVMCTYTCVCTHDQFVMEGERRGEGEGDREREAARMRVRVLERERE